MSDPKPRLRGFAAMPEALRKSIAAKGGRSVPDEKRGFSQDRELAKRAGAAGGRNSQVNRREAVDQ